MNPAEQADIMGRAGCATAQPAQPGDRAGAAEMGWTDTPPLPYRADKMPPPWYWATDFYRRQRRRPRCEGGED
jgi:hypothetical protein